MAVYKKPISLITMATTLGVSPTLRAVCRANAINPKSRIKPVEYAASTGPLGETQFKEANWGYVIPEPTNQATFRNYLVSNTIPAQWEKPELDAIDMGYGWWYRKPSTWYRLLDFDGYDSSTSGSLLGSMSCSSTMGSTFTVWYYTGIYSIYDFVDMSGMHFGIAILTPNNTLYFKTTLDSDTSAQITLSSSEKSQVFNTDGTYKIYAIATTDSVSLTNQLTSFIALPADILSINYTYGGSEVTKSVRIRFDSVSVDSCILWLENNSSASVTASNLYVEVYQTDGYGNTEKRVGRYGPYYLTANAKTSSSIYIDISESITIYEQEYGVKIAAYSGEPTHWDIDYTLHTFIS